MFRYIVNELFLLSFWHRDWSHVSEEDVWLETDFRFSGMTGIQRERYIRMLNIARWKACNGDVSQRLALGAFRSRHLGMRVR